MLDPSCKALAGKPETDAYCWRCDAYAPVESALKHGQHGWVAKFKPHQRALEER